MPQVSAGLLMYRRHGGVLEFLLVHPGGPFWKNKDAGAWTIAQARQKLNPAQAAFLDELSQKQARL